MKSGIYAIKNKKNDRIYIGSSFDIDKRIYAHKQCLKNRRHINNDLQNEWDSYSDYFEFIVLEKCDNSELGFREKHHIDKYKKSVLYNKIYDVSRKRKQCKDSGKKLRSVYLDDETIIGLKKIAASSFGSRNVSMAITYLVKNYKEK